MEEISFDQKIEIAEILLTIISLMEKPDDKFVEGGLKHFEEKFDAMPENLRRWALGTINHRIRNLSNSSWGDVDSFAKKKQKDEKDSDYDKQRRIRQCKEEALHVLVTEYLQTLKAGDKFKAKRYSSESEFEFVKINPFKSITYAWQQTRSGFGRELAVPNRIEERVRWTSYVKGLGGVIEVVLPDEWKEKIPAKEQEILKNNLWA